MPITGGIKFFEPSLALLKDGVVADAAVSGSATEDNVIDKNELSFWRSILSDDSTTETIEITLPAARDVDRLFLLNHNFKSYNVKYHDGGGFVDFANVVGITTPAGPGVAETAFAQDSSYYEFDSVNASRFLLSVTTVQDPGNFLQKKLAQFVVCEELGTLVGYPRVTGLRQSRNSRNRKMLSGRKLIQKGQRSHRFQLNLRDYPGSETGDIDLVFSLDDRDDDFMVWLCGGRFGTDFFRYTLPGWRLRDLLTMNVAKDVSIDYKAGVYVLPVRVRMELEEVV